MIDVTGWQWLNEPKSWSAGDALNVRTDSDTDFWRITHYGFIRDTGHFLAREVSGDFRLRTRFAGAYTHQYDQAGAMLRLDAENWIKTGIEYVDGRQHASVVVTRGLSDWSVTPIETADQVSIEIERSGDTVTVRYGVDQDEPTTMLRLAYYPPEAPTLAGVMCASPDGPGYSVALTGWSSPPGEAYRGVVRFRFLLQPNWLMLTLVVFVFAAACYTLLAPWQFSRNADQQAQNAALTASFSSKPVPLGQLVPAGSEPSGQAVWRLVTMTGSYEPAGEAMARLRTVQGEPAFEIVTPFRLTDGRTVLVDRGYEPPQAGKSVPTYLAPPTGQVTITARAQDDEPADKRPSFLDTGKRQIYSINSGTVAQAAGVRLDPGYYQLAEKQPGVVHGGAIPLPQLDDGPYFSYALQWIIFGSMALFGWGYFSWREARPGGALDNSEKPKRRSVAEILAEDEARDREQAAAARG